MSAIVVTPRRIEFHHSSDPVIRVQFPMGSDGSVDQAFVEMPAIFSEPYGLEREWGFRLQEPDRLAVFIPVRPGWIDPPDIAVGMIFPCHTLPVELKVVGGYAIALIDLDEEVDLKDREGYITLYAERTSGKEWLREPSLIYGLVYLAVSLLVVRKFLRELIAAVRNGQMVVSVLRTLVLEH